MAFYSKVTYDGDGIIAGPHNFNKGYLNKSHIHCYVDSVEVSFTFVTSSTILLDDVPIDGAVILIQRETPKESPFVDFSNGSILMEQNLDNSVLQVLYVTQEGLDNISGTLGPDLTGNFDALNKQIKNLAPGTEAGDAVTYEQIISILDDVTALAAAASDDADDAAASALVAAEYDFEDHTHETEDITGLDSALSTLTSGIAVSVASIAAVDSDLTTLEANAVRNDTGQSFGDDGAQARTNINAESKSNFFHIQDRKTTNAQALVSGWNIRQWNTIIRNDIVGASLTSNRITLPAGTYKIKAWAVSFQGTSHQIRLYDYTNSIEILAGNAPVCHVSYHGANSSVIEGEITLSSTVELEVQHAIQHPGYSATPGAASYTIYANIEIQEII